MSKVHSQGWSYVGVEPRLLHPCFFMSNLLLLLNRKYKWVGESKKQKMAQ